MHRNKSVDVHQFSMVPRAEIPRSSFRIQKSYKTAFDAGLLIPIYVDEVLPGDTFNLNMTAFARLATPIFPIMDNLHLDSFFFFVPCRLLWDKWQRFMGEQIQPGASIAFVIPQVSSPVSGFAVSSLGDYFGLPTVGQVSTGEVVSVSALPFRAYNLIWNEWFRDQNLQEPVVVLVDDGPDTVTDYNLLRRGKRHDYFTSCLPFVQKGASVGIPLGTSAPVSIFGNAQDPTFFFGSDRLDSAGSLVVDAGVNPVHVSNINPGATRALYFNDDPDQTGLSGLADLSQATAATINQLRQAFQIQKLLERDARGGTRYTEIVRSHFGVISPDARLQRPEYLGGGSVSIGINPVAQTSQTDATTPQGNLAAFGTSLGRSGFTQSFTEHGYIIGLVMVRADLTYQQGIRKMWSRSTRYDFYFPVFAALGEQAVLMREIFATGEAAIDEVVFGYQERWAEYRYNPSQITGLMRSTSAQTIDPWHLAQRFVGAPTLNATFIQEFPPLERVLAVGSGAAGQQLLFDAFFDIRAARPMPIYSVPGLIDHF